jgi:hypothetical protein
MVTVKTYSNVPEAELERSFLAASGIKSYLVDENSASLGLGPIVQVRLQVRDKDAKRAKELLDDVGKKPKKKKAAASKSAKKRRS